MQKNLTLLDGAVGTSLWEKAEDKAPVWRYNLEIRRLFPSSIGSISTRAPRSFWRIPSAQMPERSPLRPIPFAR